MAVMIILALHVLSRTIVATTLFMKHEKWHILLHNLNWQMFYVVCSTGMVVG